MRQMRRNQSGQTLIIALLILGVLLVLGVVFAGIISRSINQTGAAFRRTQSGDLAEGGARFAHYQLRYSELGADWRPSPTPPLVDVAGLTRDPDAFFLRPAPGAGNPGLQATDRFGNAVPDLGGPDGLGPYSRVLFEKGRSLIRVRYAAGKLDGFTGLTQLQNPAKARNYIVIESLGRPGKVTQNDPTTLTAEATQITGHANQAAFNQAIGKLRLQSSRVTESRRLVAFASIGLIEHTWFITDKFRVSRPAEIGSLFAPEPVNPGDPVPESNNGNFGVTYEGQRVSPTETLGGEIFDIAGNSLTRGAGSFWANPDVTIHGRVEVNLDPRIGDSFVTAGRFKAANSQSVLRLNIANGPVVNTTNLSNQQLNSNSGQFGTYGGVLRDGVQSVDNDGYARAINRKEAPSFLEVDPASGVNRYAQLTRQSGVQIFGGPNQGRNSGQFGHGRGVYVDSRERANFASESDRESADAAKALTRDWLNPNNPDSVAWKGPFYIPVASYLKFTPDGFEITRDNRSQNRTWRTIDGSPTTTPRIRYRLFGAPRFTKTYIVNSVNNPALIDQPYSTVNTASVIADGQEFNGLVFFEGDVRVRGVIPTDEQLTVASMGTIYVEGSITKGVVDQVGATLTRPSRSALMMMAKDYICVNTTMFFGPTPAEVVNPKRSEPTPNTPNPIELTLADRSSVSLQTQFLLDPTNPTTRLPESNPSLWLPYATEYTSQGGSALSSTFLMSHSADENGPTFVRMGVTNNSFRPVAADPNNATYFFSSPGLAGNFNGFNAQIGAVVPATGSVPIYGLTSPNRDAYPKFEVISVPFVSSTFTYTNRRLNTPGGNSAGAYTLAVQDESEVQIQLASDVAAFPTKGYALNRVAVQPHDIRIEAAMYAEEGSFYVIPGPAFNQNRDDSRERFLNAIVRLGTIQLAQEERYRTFGSMPESPFFGEPLNVRVSILGAISENMPAPIADKAAWQRLWGWMPRYIGGSGNPTATSATGMTSLPTQHIPVGWNMDFAFGAVDPTLNRYVPNFAVTYDPMLSLGSADGRNPVRTNADGWALPPMPRLPVSPTLAYFGEVNP